jgi:hypothetical protein
MNKSNERRQLNFPKGFRVRHLELVGLEWVGWVVGGVGGKVETNEIRLISSIDGFGDELNSPAKRNRWILMNEIRLPRAIDGFRL